MGDWERIFGAGYTFNDFERQYLDTKHLLYDAKQEKELEIWLTQNEYLSLEEWNSVGRVIIKGSKAQYTKYGTAFFSYDQTAASHFGATAKKYIKMRPSKRKYRYMRCFFNSFQDASIWAKKNPHRIIKYFHTANLYVGTYNKEIFQHTDFYKIHK